MTTEQIDIYFSGIKGIVDASCIKYWRDKTSKRFKKDVKYRCSNFIPSSYKRIMKLALSYAIKQYLFYKTTNNVRGEFYKITESYGDTLLMLLRNAEK